MPEEPLVVTRDLAKIYKIGEVEAPALRDIDLEINPGEFLSIVGPSGSGKTTLLNLIGLLDTPTKGELHVLGADANRMSRRDRAEMRLRSLGFVFQAYNLVPVLTARENVEFVLELQGLGKERSERAKAILGELGLSEFADRRPKEMSGGQQQRVAVARAVASRPRLVLADEPTANLDGENAKVLLDMMARLNQEHGITFVFSTHDPRVIAYAQRVVTLEDGEVSKDERQTPAHQTST
jgi:putative ABC transport system ATP-binding protein